MITAFSYTRFSTGRQAKGDTIRRQDEIAAAICQREGWTLNTTLRFSDHGKSGFHGKNIAKGGDLARFMACIENGEVQSGNVFIVESLDRISRQAPLDSLEIIKQILKAGVTIRTGFDGMTYTYESVNQNNGQLFTLLGILQRAHEESKTKSQGATASGHNRQNNASAERPVTTGRNNLPAWIRCNAAGELELIPHHAATMKEIIRLGISGMGSADAV